MYGTKVMIIFIFMMYGTKVMIIFIFIEGISLQVLWLSLLYEHN